MYKIRILHRVKIPIKRDMAMETIISSLITAAVTLVVCLMTNHAQSQKTQALIEYRLDELTRAVERHNSVIDRTNKLEQDLAVQGEHIKSIDDRLDSLERSA